ncbi:MAG: hypothetical protein KAT28_02595 [Candidatus Aenigmarchaeota archaeon]|nr:hypothetical protein [Candidatus Aenigmarchaeota archaeon]
MSGNINLINLDVGQILHKLLDWTKNKEKGMPVGKYYKKLKDNGYSNLKRETFNQILINQKKEGIINIYKNKKGISYIELNNNY